MKLVKQELDVGLATLNVESLKHFYGEVMGFEALPVRRLEEVGTQWCFVVGNHHVKINDFTKTPQREEGGVNAIGIRLLAFILDDLGSLLGRFDRAGISYRTVPIPEEAPIRVAFAADPDGNALELVGLRHPAGNRLKARMQIALTVSDVERSKHFYGELLGFTREPDMELPADMGVVGNVRHGFTAGHTTIKFWSMGDGLPFKTGAPARRTGIRLITAFVDDLDATHEQMRRRGVQIKAAPHELAGTARVMFIADPDGNWIEFIQAAERDT